MGRRRKGGVSQKTCRCIVFNAFGLKATTVSAWSEFVRLYTRYYFGRMMLRVVAFFFFVCFALNISAQSSDTIHSIEGVEITAEKMSAFSAGIKIEKIDSTVLSIRQGSNIATLLSETSPISLRSYGPGGISTLSVRGTNSAHSGIFWNGINLNQPNLGMTDLSRISSFEFSDISLQSGGASSLLGSGVIGGSLHLANKMKFSTPTRATLWMSGSDAGKSAGALKISAGNNRLAYVGSSSVEWNRNNFRYQDFSGNNTRLEHALVKSVSTIHEAQYILNSKQRLSAGLWYQQTYREIPPTMTMTSSDQLQSDRAIRSTLQWSYAGKNQSFIVRSAFIDEKEHYKSENLGIDARYHLNTLQSEFEYKRYLNKHYTLGAGITANLVYADVPYYNGVKNQPGGALWMALAYSLSPEGIKAVVNLRQDVTKGYKVPFCPSVHAEVPLTSRISTSFGISRNFRVPTLNDRFWIPGGNPDLKPENSWNFEAGATWDLPELELFQSEISLAFYNLLIDDLIQWVPGNAGIWSPVNVQKVWSRGMELSSKTDWKLAGFKGYFKLGYNYSPSTFRNTIPGENSDTDKQLIYIPVHKVNETFYVVKGAYYAMFSYTLTGKRFVQSDNAKALPSYTTLDFYTGWTFKAEKFSFRLQAEIHNVLNTTYQSVQYYPEPGRTFSLNLLISN